MKNIFAEADKKIYEDRIKKINNQINELEIKKEKYKRKIRGLR